MRRTAVNQLGHYGLVRLAVLLILYRFSIMTNSCFRWGSLDLEERHVPVSDLTGMRTGTGRSVKTGPRTTLVGTLKLTGCIRLVRSQKLVQVLERIVGSRFAVVGKFCALKWTSTSDRTFETGRSLALV